MDDADYMRLALAKAREGIAAGQSPFAACIVSQGRVLACSHNEVWLHHDITAHAEIQALRSACAATKQIFFSDAVIYCTCEPCPMCFGAIHWSRIDRIVFGTTVADAKSYGFHELPISNAALKRESGSPIRLEGGLLSEESHELFRFWAQSSGRRTY